MKSEISVISSIVKEGMPLLAKHVGDSSANQLAEYVQHRATDATPTVMVFGIYNAGKSTLLNALIGEERASVADRPETCMVTPYEWNGFNILDTPGIDAPADHEQVSRKQLQDSDIVLFILSTNGSFDEKKIYDEILEIVEAKKPIIVIVNNKDGYTEADAEYRDIYQKVLTNLDAAGKNKGLHGLSERVAVRLVNAKLALRGKLDGKHALVDASGFPSLAREIEELLKQSGPHNVAVTLRGRVIEVIDAAIKSIDSSENSVDARLIAEQKAALEGEKSRVISAVSAGVQRAAADFRSSFKAAIDPPDKSAMEAAMEAAIAATTTVMEREVKLAGAVLSDIGASLLNLESIHDRISFSVNAGNTHSENDQKLEAENDSFLKDELLGGLQKAIPGLTKESIEATTKEATKAALVMTKEYIPNLMKGIGVKGMEKMAENAAKTVGRATPFIGPAIDTVKGIYDYYQASKNKKELEDALRRKAQALEDHVVKTTADLEAELHAACNSVLVPFFLPVERMLKDQTYKLARESQQAAVERDKLSLLKSRLDYLV